MTPPDPFFKSPKTWSQRKHRLLRNYLQPFVAKVGSQSDVVYCVDGFAGTGRFEDGKPGSPLLTAELADVAATWSRPVTLKIINVEANDENFESLRNHTSPWAERGIVRNLHGKFSDMVPEILREVGKARAFFFIDPFGPTGIPFSSLRPILERPQRVTELIVNFDLDGLRRITDATQSKDQSARGRKTVQTDIARVTDIIGNDTWKASLSSGQLTTAERERVLLDLYVTKLKGFQYQVVAYPIRKSLRESPKYYLIFCTRHRHGVMLMNDAIRDEEDGLIRDSTTVPGQAMLPLQDFDAVGQNVLQRREALNKLVLAYFEAAKRATRGSLKEKFKFEHFGEFHERDYNAVFQELVNIGLLKTQHGLKQFNNSVPLTYVG